jgi:hypothetical protein
VTNQALPRQIWIVSQGPLNHYSEVIHTYNGLNVIHSTWATKEVYTPHFDNHHFIIQDPPLLAGKGNINYQVKSTLSGLLEAKRRGAEYVLKVRSDFSFSDLPKLLEILFKKTSEEPCIYFLSFVTHEGGYFMDFVQFGKIDDLINLWSIGYKINYIHRKSPEVYLTKNFEKHFSNRCAGNVSYKYARYILPIMYQEKIKLTWHKRKITSDQWRGNPMFLFADL